MRNKILVLTTLFFILTVVGFSSFIGNALNVLAAKLDEQGIALSSDNDLSDILNCQDCELSDKSYLKYLRNKYGNFNFSYFENSIIDKPIEVSSNVIESGYSLRGNPTYYPKEVFDWEQNPNKDRNWQFSINSFSPLNSIFLAHRLTNNRKYMEVSFIAIENWINENIF